MRTRSNPINLALSRAVSHALLLLPLWSISAAFAQAPAVVAAAAADTPLESLPRLTVSTYLGTWYQVAWFPNVFQRQCVSDTAANYRLAADGKSVVVTNRCKLASGAFDEAVGQAKPVGSLAQDELAPAKLKVSFLPVWLRWLPVGWGDYWVIQRAEDGRYAVVSEGSRRYLWILSRTPQISAADDQAIRSRLLAQGFDLSELVLHPHTLAPSGSKP